MLFKKLSSADLSVMPYMNAKGYHNKTIAYSPWHIFRIDDIVDYQQIIFQENYKIRMHSPIITTGNELIKEEIAEFSKEL